MALAERIYDGLRNFLRINDRVEGMMGDLKALADEVDTIDRRLIRVETAMEMATRGAFAPRPQRLDPPEEG